MNDKKGYMVGDTIRVNGVDYIIKFTQSGMNDDKKHLDLILRCESVKELQEMNETTDQ